MKVKPLEYLQGGSLFLPVNVQLERANPHYLQQYSLGEEDSKLSSKSGKKSGLESILSDDLLKTIMSHALPNEGKKFIDFAIQLQKKSELGAPISSSQVLALRKLEFDLIHNHKVAEETRKTMTELGVRDEIALSADGEMYNLKADGLVERVSLGLYDPEKHLKILTNGELESLRESSDQFINDKSVFTTIANAQSPEKIVSFINDVLSKAKGSANKQEFVTNLKVLNAKGLNGITDLEAGALLSIAAAGVTGELLLSYSKESNSDLVRAALSLLNRVMPTAMSLYLFAKTMVDRRITLQALQKEGGLTPLFRDLATQTFNEAFSIKPSTIKADGSKSGSSGGKSPVTRTAKFFHRVIETPVLLTDPSYARESGRALDIVVSGSTETGLMDIKEHKQITEPMSLDKALNLDGQGWARYCDRGTIWLGAQKRAYDDAQNILYDPNAGISTVTLPIQNNGDLDSKLLENIQDALQEERNRLSKQSLTPEEMRNALKRNGVDKVSVNSETGVIEFTGNKGNFLLVYGYVLDDVLAGHNGKKDLKEIKFFKQLNKRERVQAENYFDIAKEKKLFNSEAFVGGWFGLGDDIIEAPVFIKLSDSVIADVDSDAKILRDSYVSEHEEAVSKLILNINEQGSIWNPEKMMQ